VAFEDRVLVGPDNGLLWPAIERLGGAGEAVDVSLSSWRLEPISATFHGRDIFAPVAAHLARGEALPNAGEEIPVDSLTALERSEPTIEPGGVTAHVISVDRYGNAALDLSDRHLPETGLRLGRALTVEAAGARHDAVFTLTFADVSAGDLILYEDSYRNLALALNRGSAAESLRVVPGDEVVLRPA
jgi:S-adenosylmethionine hydrolase